jgi:ribosomal protein S18 acetylase RimI-like enzyme
MKLHIADFRAADADPLVRMWRASFEHGVGIVDPHPIEDQIAYLQRQLVPSFRLRVAWEESTIVGFLASNPESIAQLYVRVGCMDRGIGSRLLELAKSESTDSLWLFTFQRNAHACRFYERRGFVAIERGFEPVWQMPDVKYRWVKSTAPRGPARSEPAPHRAA